MSSKHKKNKSKRFDKKNAHRFALMHRSHHDPLFDVPGASKFVLRPQTENPDTEEFLEELQSRVDMEARNAYEKMKREELENAGGEELDQLFREEKDEDGNIVLRRRPIVLEDVNEFGVAKDGYDYNQHTKTMGEGTFVATDGSVVNASAAVVPPSVETSITAAEEIMPVVDAIALSTENMAPDLAECLGEQGDVEFELWEDLDDDFILQAGETPKDQADQVFDFDAHVQRLMRQAEGIYSDAEGGGDEDDEEGEEFSDYEEDDMHTTSARGGGRTLEPTDVDFEKFLENDYNEENIGDLEEQIGVEGYAEQEGGMDMEDGSAFDAIMDAYLEKEALKKVPHDIRGSDSEDEDEAPTLIEERVAKGTKAKDIAIIMAAVEKQQEEELDGNMDALKLAVAKVAKSTSGKSEILLGTDLERPLPRRFMHKWDVESITSTYSNLENHPKVLKDPSMKRWQKGKRGGDNCDSSSLSSYELPDGRARPAYGIPKQISLSRKTGMPILEEEGEVEEEDDDEEAQRRVNLGARRNRKETKEEKKARKKAVQLARQARRQEKKGLKDVYKDEEGRQKRAGVGGPAPSIYRIQ